MCREVRQAARKTKDHLLNEPVVAAGEHEWSLADFEVGPVIAKGCSAVVYAAKCIVNGFTTLGEGKVVEEEKHPLAVKMMFNFHAESNAQTILRAMKKETIVAQSLNKDNSAQWLLKGDDQICISPHPNIVKMYTAFVDDVPVMSDSMDLYPDALPKRLACFSKAKQYFHQPIIRRINPHGYGRNMSLFVVMKRYRSSLRTYLSERPPSSSTWRSNLIILTQILEGIVHLSRYKVAHRDLKTDNILVSYPDGQLDSGSSVEVVITDFGCCWANPSYGFRCPYTTEDIDKGGNAALMAPEVANASTGLFSFINYEKADVWAVGAIAYEIFGLDNPFYCSQSKKSLDSRSYR